MGSRRAAAHQECCVVALDLSGHGDSGRRDRYPTSTWAKEIVAVAEHAGIAGPPVVIGHSMGGWVAITAAAEQGERLDGIVILDSPVSRLAPEEDAAAEGAAFGPLRTYPTLDAALGALPHRPRPADVAAVRARPRRRARRCARSTAAGRGSSTRASSTGRCRPASCCSGCSCRVALFRSEHGLVTPDIGAYMYEQLGRLAPVVEVPLAYHHVMLDQPIALVTGLRTLLADWEHSVPHRRT